MIICQSLEDRFGNRDHLAAGSLEEVLESPVGHRSLEDRHLEVQSPLNSAR